MVCSVLHKNAKFWCESRRDKSLRESTTAGKWSLSTNIVFAAAGAIPFPSSSSQSITKTAAAAPTRCCRCCRATSSHLEEEEEECSRRAWQIWGRGGRNGSRKQLQRWLFRGSGKPAFSWVCSLEALSLQPFCSPLPLPLPLAWPQSRSVHGPVRTYNAAVEEDDATFLCADSSLALSQLLPLTHSFLNVMPSDTRGVGGGGGGGGGGVKV